MDETKRTAIEHAGFRTTTVQEFFMLTAEEMEEIERRVEEAARAH